MIEGTTPENFQVNNGGWNCGHKLTPVSEVVVPQEIKNKFLRNIKSIDEIDYKINKIKEIENLTIKQQGHLGLQFTPQSDIITRKLLEIPTGILKQKFLKEIIKDKEFVQYNHKISGIQEIGKTLIHPMHKKGIGFEKEIEIAKDLNLNKRDVAMLAESNAVSNSDVITSYKGKYVISELKYSTTTKVNTLKKDVKKGFEQSKHLVLKSTKADLDLLINMFDEMKRKKWKLGNITIINEYGKLKDIDETEIRNGRYVKLLRGFL